MKREGPACRLQTLRMASLAMFSAVSPAFAPARTRRAARASVAVRAGGAAKDQVCNRPTVLGLAAAAPPPSCAPRACPAAVRPFAALCSARRAIRGAQAASYRTVGAFSF